MGRWKLAVCTVFLALGASRILACVDAPSAAAPDLTDASLKIASGPTPGFDGGTGAGVWQPFGTSPFTGCIVGLADDSARKVLIAYVFADAGPQTWQWNGAAWSNVNVVPPTIDSPAVTGSLTAVMTNDAKRERVVLVGSLSGTLVTMEWDGSSWTKSCGFGGTPACAAALSGNLLVAGLTFDSDRNASVLLIADPLSATSLQTWSWNGSSWSAICGAASAPACTGEGQFARGVGFVHDQSLTKDFWFGAEDTTTSPNLSIAALTGTTWSASCVDCGATGIAGLALAAYDAPRARTIFVQQTPLHFGTGGNPPLSTLDWDGNNLVDVCGTCEPNLQTISYESALAFDSTRNRVVLVTKPGISNDYSVTYVFHVHGEGCVADGDCNAEAPNCVDGVCSDSLCSACEVANAPGLHGACTQVVAGATTARCQGTCNAAGTCIRSNGVACSAGTDCSSGNCVDDVCCDGPCNGGECNVCSIATGAEKDGVCAIAKSGTTCGAYVCDGTKVACPTSCTSNTDCSKGNLCESKVCVATVGCIDDHTAKLGDGTSQSCGAYKCIGSSCATPCASVNDCVAPNICNTSGACVPPSSGDSSGCNTTDADESSEWFLFVIGAFALTLVRRKKEKRYAQ